MSDFSKAFGTDSVPRSSKMTKEGCGQPDCNPCSQNNCCDSKAPLDADKIITGVNCARHNETGKNWLTADCLYYDKSCNQWKVDCDGIVELPAKYDAGDTMPSVPGVWTAYTNEGEEFQVYGNQPLRGDMAGFFLCLNGEVCYVGGKPAEAETVTTMTVAGTVVTYTAEDGTVSTFDFCQCAETITSLVPDNAASTITYTDENGATTVVDMCALVASCIPAETPESVTTLTLSPTGDSFTYVSENGTVTTVPFCAVCPVETVTTIVPNPAGGFTYTNEAGVAVTVADTSGTAVDNGNGTGTVTFPDGTSCTFLKSVTFPTDMHVTDATFQESADGSMHELILTFANGTSLNAGPVVDANTFATVVDNGATGTVTDPNGNACTFLKQETVTTLVPATGGGFTYTNEAGAVTNIPAAAGETVTTMTVAGTVVTYTSENGTVSSFDFCQCAETITSLVANNAASTITYTDENGVPTVVDMCALVASCIPAETVTSLVPVPGGGFNYTNEAGVVTNIPASTGETVTTLTLNAAGNEFVYTSENGTVTTVPFCDVCPVETVTTLVPVPGGGFNYTNENGVVTNIPASSGETVTTLVANPDGTLTYTSEDGTATVIPAAAVSSLAESGGVVTHTAGDGTVVNFDICAIVAAECNSPMVINPDGSITYTDNAGNVTNIPASIGETVTTLVANPDGSLTYTSEDGTATTITAGTVVDNGDGSGTITLPDGSTCDFVKFPLPAAVASNITDNGDGTATITQTDGTTKDVLCAGTVSTVVDNGDGSATVTQNDGTTCDLVKSPLNQTAVVDNGDGTGSVTDADGNVCVFAKGPIVIPPGTVSSMVDNGDGTWTHTSGAGTETTITSGGLVDNGDGTATITFPDGSTKDVLCAGSVSTVVDNGDGTATITQNDGTTKDIICAPLVQATVADNGDGTATVTDSTGAACDLVKAPLAQATVTDNADGTVSVVDAAGTACDVNAVSTVINCDVPREGLIQVEQTDLKSGAVTTNNFASVRKCTRVYGSLTNQLLITADDPTGTTYELISGSFDLPCEQDVEIFALFEILTFGTPSNFDEFSRVAFTIEVQYDGAGAWNQIGGITSVHGPRQQDSNVLGDDCNTLPAGTHTYVIRLSIFNQFLQSGEVLNVTQYYGTHKWNEMTCCPE